MATSSPQIKCQLTEWGLPPLIVSWFRKRGITSLFPWQVECLCHNNVLYGENLVYSAPTSAGKTLVGDFLLLKKVLEYGKKALVIEPFVALTREKALTLKSMLYTTKARVGTFGGSYYTPGGMAAVSVAVCTIEKANNFVNKLIADDKLSDLGIIVVDEIHYIGDESRGHQLELLLTKILYYNSSRDRCKRIQIVGLSATLPNLESIASWLKASLYVTGYRPVPLVEKIKIENKIYNVNDYLANPNCEPSETINFGRIVVEKDYDDICYICIESIIAGHSVLVFCETKRECESMAKNLRNQILNAGRRQNSEVAAHAEVAKKLRENISGPKISEVLQRLKKCPAGPDKELVKSLDFGVAFHHAGLTVEEREIIEDAFKGGALKVIMCTSTLSSGVNLPARRVIIRGPTMISSNGGVYQKEMLNPITYRQMIGRAGRKNIDTCGESILICNPENQGIALKLIKAALGNIRSSLEHRMIASEGEPTGLKKAILEAIVNSTAQTKVQLNEYLQSTFWYICLASKGRDIDTVEKKNRSGADDSFMKPISCTLRYLVEKKFIEQLKPTVFKSTRLGNAVMASGLHPDDSLELLQDLTKARHGFCLLNDLHIIYQVTPNDIARALEVKDWNLYQTVWENLDETCKNVGERVGIDEITLNLRCQGKLLHSLGEEKERIYRRFWAALILNELINEVPLPKICANYGVTKAVVQQVQGSVAQFAGVMSIFCQELGYNNIAALVKPLESRINFSCQHDLLDLIRLNVSRGIARALFNAGYKNVIAVAKGDKLDIEFAIRQIKPFKKDSSFNFEKNESPVIWIPELAKNMDTLAYASHLVETARNVVEVDYEIDLTSTIAKRKEDNQTGDELDMIDEGVHSIRTPTKRKRLENEVLGNEAPLELNQEVVIAESDDEMVRANKDVPTFVVKYVGRDSRGVDRFLNNWVVQSTISLNFKLVQLVDQPIGAKIKKPLRKRRRSRGGSEEDEAPSDSEVTSSEDGLALQLDIDNKRQIVTRLYVCFGDDFTVYVVDRLRDLEQIRDKLVENLTKFEANQRQEDHVPIKLYVQNIVLTYKVLYAAFGLSESILNRHFEWFSFDVAWWMIQDCPHRGLNNQNSSLSLVAKTKWAAKFRHFLHPSTKKSRRNELAPGRSFDRATEELLKMKDIVKSGKTAILQPLINELMIELRKRNQYDAYLEAEIHSRLTMAQMMIHGIGIDMKSMRYELNLYDDLMQQLTDIAQKYYAKSTISLTRIRDVARVLYDDLDLKHYLLEHGTNADISKDPTHSEVLSILSRYHPFPKLVQDFRKIGKALEALQSVNTHARFNGEFNMMRVFGQCDFWQLTGRIAMCDPDLFLINRNFSIVLPAHGNREEEVVECAPRKCFVPTNGWIFVAADYSQLELRLLADFSNEQNLLEILNRDLDSEETFDVFKMVASKIYQLPLNEVTNENRQHAKQICYGIIYGMGNKTLASRLGLDVESAERFRQDFFNAFPQILTYTEELIADCEQLGYVESLLGRRRVIEGINSDHSSDKSRAKRVAINTRIQSSASDIIKLAMKTVHQKIISNFNGNARLVLEMHDELIYEVNPEFLDCFSRTLKSNMERLDLLQNLLKVKLLVNVKKGTNWSQLESFL